MPARDDPPSALDLSALRPFFDRFVARVSRHGPITVYAQKTSIVFQARVRFLRSRVRRI